MWRSSKGIRHNSDLRSWIFDLQSITRMLDHRPAKVVDLEMKGMMIFLRFIVIKKYIFYLLFFNSKIIFIHLFLGMKPKLFKPKFDKITKN